MSQISLHAQNNSTITMVPNIFIDEFMPSSNGSYVKVYLYLLRNYQANTAVTLSSIADQLEDTEKDILRALKYWEKMNLLSLKSNERKEITEIHFTDLYSRPKIISDTVTSPAQTYAAASESEYTASKASEPAPLYGSSRVSEPAKAAPRQSYPPETIERLTANDEFKCTMNACEFYLERPLKPMDLQLIIYLHEELDFTNELIMYLYEYCTSKGKKTPSYIEAVALTWAQEGINSEEKARDNTFAYNEHINAVNKAFGLNRAPGQIERQYIKKWVEVFHFTDDILTEACNRTILRTQKPDFKYTNKILETWHKKGAKTIEDITRLDAEFNRGNKSSGETKSTSQTKPSTNKFNQYPQRNYSTKDYAELERKLLSKGL